MTKNKIQNLNDLISENINSSKEAEDMSYKYKNFVHIGSQGGKDDEKLHPKKEIFNDFTSKLESLGKQLNYVSQKTLLSGSNGINLKRECHLINGEHISTRRLNTIKEFNSDFDLMKTQS